MLAIFCNCTNPDWCLPIKSQPKSEVFAFWTGADDWKSSSWDWGLTTTVAVFGNAIPTMDFVCKAHANGARVVKGADFPKDQLTNATARSAWISTQVDYVTSNLIDGVNIDIEGNTANRDELTALVSELNRELKAVEPAYQLSFDLGINPDGQTNGYDHKALSQSLDFILPMAYDECWNAKQGAANSPIDRLTAGVQQYAALGVGPEKLVMGLPWYAWRFPCNSSALGTPCEVVVPQGKQWYGWVTQISYTDAIDTMASSKATPVLDNATMTQHFDFMANVAADLTSNGDRAEIWFDNPETLSSKYSLCKKLGVKGVAFWTADEVSYSEGTLAQDMWTALESFLP